MKDNKDYTRRNRFNGESVELTPEECKKHDDIVGPAILIKKKALKVWAS